MIGGTSALSVARCVSAAQSSVDELSERLLFCAERPERGGLFGLPGDAVSFSQRLTRQVHLLQSAFAIAC